MLHRYTITIIITIIRKDFGRLWKPRAAELPNLVQVYFLFCLSTCKRSSCFQNLIFLWMVFLQVFDTFFVVSIEWEIKRSQLECLFYGSHQIHLFESYLKILAFYQGSRIPFFKNKTSKILCIKILKAFAI